MIFETGDKTKTFPLNKKTNYTLKMIFFFGSFLWVLQMHRPFHLLPYPRIFSADESNLLYTLCIYKVRCKLSKIGGLTIYHHKSKSFYFKPYSLQFKPNFLRNKILIIITFIWRKKNNILSRKTYLWTHNDIGLEIILFYFIWQNRCYIHIAICIVPLFYGHWTLR